MGRTVDSHAGTAGRQAASRVGAIRAGLANGSMVRGTTPREATGDGRPPTWGAIMLPAQVDAVTPPLGRRQAAVGWEVIGPTEVVGRGWRAPVVGIAEVVARGQTLAAV